jgi:hypothetical protein
MPPAGFEPAIPASERPRTYALQRAATGISLSRIYQKKTLPLMMMIMIMMMMMMINTPYSTYHIYNY